MDQNLPMIYTGINYRYGTDIQDPVVSYVQRFKLIGLRNCCPQGKMVLVPLHRSGHMS